MLYDENLMNIPSFEFSSIFWKFFDSKIKKNDIKDEIMVNTNKEQFATKEWLGELTIDKEEKNRFKELIELKMYITHAIRDPEIHINAKYMCFIDLGTSIYIILKPSVSKNVIISLLQQEKDILTKKTSEIDLKERCMTDEENSNFLNETIKEMVILNDICTKFAKSANCTKKYNSINVIKLRNYMSRCGGFLITEEYRVNVSMIGKGRSTNCYDCEKKGDDIRRNIRCIYMKQTCETIIDFEPLGQPIYSSIIFALDMCCNKLRVMPNNIVDKNNMDFFEMGGINNLYHSNSKNTYSLYQRLSKIQDNSLSIEDRKCITETIEKCTNICWESVWENRLTCIVFPTITRAMILCKVYDFAREVKVHMLVKQDMKNVNDLEGFCSDYSRYSFLSYPSSMKENDDKPFFVIRNEFIEQFMTEKMRQKINYPLEEENNNRDIFVSYCRKMGNNNDDKSDNLSFENKNLLIDIQNISPKKTDEFMIREDKCLCAIHSPTKQERMNIFGVTNFHFLSDYCGLIKFGDCDEKKYSNLIFLSKNINCSCFHKKAANDLMKDDVLKPQNFSSSSNSNIIYDCDKRIFNYNMYKNIAEISKNDNFGETQEHFKKYSIINEDKVFKITSILFPNRTRNKKYFLDIPEKKIDSVIEIKKKEEIEKECKKMESIDDKLEMCREKLFYMGAEEIKMSHTEIKMKLIDAFLFERHMKKNRSKTHQSLFPLFSAKYILGDGSGIIYKFSNEISRSEEMSYNSSFNTTDVDLFLPHSISVIYGKRYIFDIKDINVLHDRKFDNMKSDHVSYKSENGICVRWRICFFTDCKSKKTQRYDRNEKSKEMIEISTFTANVENGKISEACVKFITLSSHIGKEIFFGVVKEEKKTENGIYEKCEIVIWSRCNVYQNFSHIIRNKNILVHHDGTLVYHMINHQSNLDIETSYVQNITNNNSIEKNDDSSSIFASSSNSKYLGDNKNISNSLFESVFLEEIKKFVFNSLVCDNLEVNLADIKTCRYMIDILEKLNDEKDASNRVLRLLFIFSIIKDDKKSNKYLRQSKKNTIIIQNPKLSEIFNKGTYTNSSKLIFFDPYENEKNEISQFDLSTIKSNCANFAKKWITKNMSEKNIGIENDLKKIEEEVFFLEMAKLFPLIEMKVVPFSIVESVNLSEIFAYKIENNSEAQVLTEDNVRFSDIDSEKNLLKKIIDKTGKDVTENTIFSVNKEKIKIAFSFDESINFLNSRLNKLGYSNSASSNDKNTLMKYIEVEISNLGKIHKINYPIYRNIKNAQWSNIYLSKMSEKINYIEHVKKNIDSDRKKYVERKEDFFGCTEFSKIKVFSNYNQEKKRGLVCSIITQDDNE